MFNLGFFGSHNASFAISFADQVLEVVEVERLLNSKNAALFYWGHHDNIRELLTEVKDYFEQKYGVTKYRTVVFNSVNDRMWEMFPAETYKCVLHHEAHAYSGLYQSSYQRALIISFDGGSDEGFFNVFIGDKFGELEKIYSGKTDYAVSYMVAGHFIRDIKQEPTIDQGNFAYAGKLMGLAGYGAVDESLVDDLIKFYKTSVTDSIVDARKRFIEIFSHLGIVDDTTRLKGEVGLNLAATNQYVFEKLFYEEVNDILEEHNTLPIVLVGGCALNILNNTILAKTRQVFVPPNPNDTGQAVGLVCSVIKPPRPVDCTYIGPEVWDRRELAKILFERKGTELDLVELAMELANGKIVGVVRGRAEHGPRALGNRSIICDPTLDNMKNILNSKVKGREFFRPFAPVVRLEDVNKYFEWEQESRWMSFCPKVRKEYRAILKEITHVDGTARVQTVTREQNSFLYDLLTELEIQKGIGVVLNTSFNIAGKPILNTYADALWMLDNKDMDGLVLEDFYIEK